MGDSPQLPVVPAPAHWRADTFRHFWVTRGSEGVPRQPVVALPGGEVGGGGFAELYWAGAVASWAELLACVGGGRDVAVLPAASGLLVLDCDVKWYHADTAFVVSERTARLAPAVQRHGIDDLGRVVRELGHSPAELATYTVRTKSGGYHLYYRVPEAFVGVLGTSHHRHEWRVDVIASQHSWVAAPPTRGYSVVRDLPVAELPGWLAAWLVSEWGLAAVPPLGQRPRVQLDDAASAARAQAARVRAGGLTAAGAGDVGDVLVRWVQLELDRVALANRYGGWNQAIYCCARNLMDAGWGLEAVLAAVEPSAAPETARDRRMLADTVSSAWRGFQRGVARSGVDAALLGWARGLA